MLVQVKATTPEGQAYWFFKKVRKSRGGFTQRDDNDLWKICAKIDPAIKKMEYFYSKDCKGSIYFDVFMGILKSVTVSPQRGVRGRYFKEIPETKTTVGGYTAMYFEEDK